MRKMMKKLMVTLIVLSCTFALCIPAMAGGDPGLNGRNYVISSKYYSPSISFTHVAVNHTSAMNYVTYSVSRQKTFSGSISGSIEANAVVYKCAITAEVSIGSSVTETTTCQWGIPPYSNITCRYGSMAVDTYGRMEKWFYGRLLSSRSVSANYTHCGYSDSYYN